MHARADTVPWPRIARGYRNLLLDAGSGDVVLEVHTAIVTDATLLALITGHLAAARRTGAVSDEQAAAWIGEQTRRAAEDRMMGAIPMFVAAGTR